VLPRAALDRLYQAGQVDPAEYVTLRLATGETEQQAHSDLASAHAGVETVQGPLGPAELREPDLPQYSGPTRTARRPSKQGNVLRGHPLD